MIYNSAGHHLKDTGAVATHSGIVYKENELAMMFRNGITKHIRSKGYKVVEDNDKETLSQYLARIEPGSGSVTCEHHMNSFSSNTATGIEVVIGDNASKETVKWEDGKEYPLLKVEISSESHPFFTGKQRVLDTEGRIDRFKKRYGKKA